MEGGGFLTKLQTILMQVVEVDTLILLTLRATFSEEVFQLPIII